MQHDYRDVLLKAASIVEQGWCQDSFHEYDNADCVVASCAVGAIARAADYLAGVEPAPLKRAAREAVEKHVSGELMEWNDEPGRTADEVASAMREAATR